MAYVTQSDLAKRTPSLKWWTDDAAAGAVDSDVVTECIALADARVDRYAGQHYQIPLSLGNSATARIVRDVSGSIALYILATRTAPGNVPDNLRADYEDALKWLESLQDGKVYPDGETQRSATKPSGGPVVLGDSVTITAESMNGL